LLAIAVRDKDCQIQPHKAERAFRRLIFATLNSATVRRVARLARLKVSEDDVPRLAGELNAILDFVEQLNEVNVDGVEPLTSVVDAQMRMRDDVVTDGGYAKDVTKNAPASEDEFFMVPKVVE
jgi:aspartyl-tRNA(Asn)/glutamyl-tRNA(Gln) amidotransferase subunit C